MTCSTSHSWWRWSVARRRGRRRDGADALTGRGSRGDTSARCHLPSDARMHRRGRDPRAAAAAHTAPGQAADATCCPSSTSSATPRQGRRAAGRRAHWERSRRWPPRTRGLLEAPPQHAPRGSRLAEHHPPRGPDARTANLQLDWTSTRWSGLNVTFEIGRRAGSARQLRDDGAGASRDQCADLPCAPYPSREGPGPSRHAAGRAGEGRSPPEQRQLAGAKPGAPRPRRSSGVAGR
jgi:hypothetical protein